MRKLAIISSHPIQYNAPFFQLLNDRKIISIKVFYTWGQASESIIDPDFGIKRSWDIPLLEGYEFEFLNNCSTKPGSDHFFGINNPDIIKKICQYNPDAILIYGWAFKSHLKVIRYFKNRVKLYFRGDSHLLNENSSSMIKKTLKKIFLKWVYSKIDVAFYTGKENKKYYQYFGLKSNQLVFAPHAVDNAKFYRNSVNLQGANQFKLRFQIPNSHLIFLFAGKLQEQKDLITLIKAFLHADLNDCCLLIAGDGNMKNELVTEASFSKNILFIPFQNQSGMPFLYNTCDVFILPSKSETWGLSINEAMAASRTILLSDKVGCSSDLVIQNHNGFIFETGNIEQLSNYLKWCDLHKKEVEDFGNNSFEIIQSWTFEKFAIALEDMINCKT